MTAGRGIIHQEMPAGDSAGQMHGFQLWANSPSSLKMTAPRYQDVEGKDVPELTDDDGTHARVIIGDFWGQRPVDGIAADPYIWMFPFRLAKTKRLKVDTYRNSFAYIFEGSASFADASAPTGVLLEKEVMGEELNIRDSAAIEPWFDLAVEMKFR